MSNWDDEDFESSKWADENREGADVDEWDAESEEEEANDTPKPVVEKPKPALTKKQALQKALELKEKEERESKNKPTSEFDIYMDEKRKKELQEASDLENSKTLFSGLAVSTNTGASPIDSFKPSTEKEFIQYADMLSDYIKKYDTSIHYLEFFKQILKKTLPDTSSKDLGEISKALNVMLNEKIKNEKNTGKGKKPAKAAVAPKRSLGRMDDEIKTYDDFDEDDFM
ncbi:hypothetical protein CYY_001544 [Polysphondylium violaceum]|uniref:Eukaryotic translation initiation factor 3 subunit J n=1 Tax=Polysphondylium violaceum TaxID=133409 RepID=A0A8J4VAI0_9MYCE|nr:hypothetical protein CYY_001544 [Polysphondylium violaceum]